MGERPIVTAKKAIIVEDNADLRLLFSLRLKKSGLKVEQAPDGQSALSLIKNHVPDLVFVDYHLPDMTGTELVRKMRENDLESAAYVIISGSNTEDIENEAKDAGVAYLARKPLSLKKLEYILENF